MATPVPLLAAGPEPAAEPTPTPAAPIPPGALAATHRVARPLINTRSGPGTETAIVTKLRAGARLALIAEQDGWGHFVLLDGDREGQEVWAALRILEAVR